MRVLEARFVLTETEPGSLLDWLLMHLYSRRAAGTERGGICGHHPPYSDDRQLNHQALPPERQVLPPASLEQPMSQILLYSALFIAMAIGAADIWTRTRGEIDRITIRRSRRAAGQ
jgi:hypothetical protein